MIKSQIENFRNGWFIGDFEPSLIKTKDFEVCVKEFREGETESLHYQRIATEITVVISGEVRMGENLLKEGELLVIHPGEVCDFEALTDCKVLGIKFPSIPQDKVLA